MLQLIMVLASFLLSDAIPGLTILHEDQSADKQREREKQEDEWWYAASPFYCTPATPLPGGEWYMRRRVSRNQHSGRDEHASQEEVGYLTSIHYFLWRCNFYGSLLFTNIAFS